MFLNDLTNIPRSMEDFTVGSKWKVLGCRSGTPDHLVKGAIIEIKEKDNIGIHFKSSTKGGIYFREGLEDGWLISVKGKHYPYDFKVERYDGRR